MQKKVLWKKKENSKQGNIYFIPQDEEDYLDYFKLDKILSFNKVFNFVIGSRSSGKSYAVKAFLFDQFIKKGRESIYLRRSKSEINKMIVENYWKDFLAENQHLSETDLLMKYDENGSSCYYQGKKLMDFLMLNKSSIYKSIPFQNKWWICFDEFNISVNRYINYLTDETTRFFEILGTVKRPYNDGTKQIIPNTRVILLGNNMEQSNPYFRYFDLEYGSEPGFYFNDVAIVQVFKNNKSEEVYGDAFKGTEYAEYAINNKSFKDNSFLIKQKPNNLKAYLNMAIEGKLITVSISENTLYVSQYYENKTTIVFRNKEDNLHNAYIGYDALKDTEYFKKINSYRMYNKIFYDSESTLQLFDKFMKYY